MSHSPPSHAAGPIRLPSLPGAPVDGRMGSRGPEKSATTPYVVESGPRPTVYFDRRGSLPVHLDSVPRRDEMNGDAHQQQHQQHQHQQWQQQPAELEDDKSRKTTPN